MRHYLPGAVIYAQGDAAERVFYLQAGHVKLAVVSSRGKEAIVGMLGPGAFFGEGCLAGQRRRMGSAIARDRVTVMAIPKRAMQTLLHEQLFNIKTWRKRKQSIGICDKKLLLRKPLFHEKLFILCLAAS